MKLHQLNRPKGQNRYCGPAVISFLTGVDTNTAAALIRDQSGKRAVKGVSTREARDALRALGVSTGPELVSGTPTLAGWLRESKGIRTPGRVFLVVAGWHYQIVSGRKYACGRVGGIVSVRDKRVKRRCRVVSVREITGTDHERQRQTLIRLNRMQDAKRTDAGQAASLRRNVITQARAHGVAVDVEGRGEQVIIRFDSPACAAQIDAGTVESHGYGWWDAQRVLDDLCDHIAAGQG